MAIQEHSYYASFG